MRCPPQMRINAHSDSDVTLPHQVLPRLGVHPCFRLIAAILMAADVRGNVRQLFPCP